MKGSIDSPLPVTVEEIKNGVYKIGPLIIQTMRVSLTWRKVTVCNYNMAFPGGVIAVFAQGRHLGEVGSNNGYYVGTSVQVAGVDNSQCKYFLSSDVNDANLDSVIIAIGY